MLFYSKWIYKSRLVILRGYGDDTETADLEFCFSGVFGVGGGTGGVLVAQFYGGEGGGGGGG